MPSNRLRRLLLSTSKLNKPYGPLLLLSRAELERDVDPMERYEELGAFAIKVALAKHLAFTYPDASKAFLDDLLQVNLSRENLTRVAERLEPKGYLAPKTVADGKGFEHFFRDGAKGFLGGKYVYAMQVAGIIFVDANYHLGLFWEKYKELLEPIVTPEDLEARRLEAARFELGMVGVSELVPGGRITVLNH